MPAAAQTTHMRRVGLSPEAAHGWLVECCLDPESFWFFGVYSRTHHALFMAASKHYLKLDEPNRAISAEYDSLITQWEQRSPDMFNVPRLNLEQRRHLIDAFIQNTDSDATRKVLTQNVKTVLESWRPGALYKLTTGAAPEVSAAWSETLTRRAGWVIEDWLATHAISIEGIKTLVEE